MAATYLYNVSADGPLTTIQSAIDKIATELKTNPLIEQDIVVNVNPGKYPGFTIPDGALVTLLSTAYRLVIQSAGRYFPVVDYNSSAEDQFVGADIGSANPHVTLKSLRFQNFPVGVRIATNSHKPKVINCLATNNRNAGILIDQADEAQVLQNVVVNGDYGIVTRLCKDVAIIHNTVFLSGNVSTKEGKAQSAIWASLAHDYGRGLTDTGKLHLLGNVSWNLVGTNVTAFVDDLERPAIVSNYNLLTLSKRDYISLEDRTFFKGSKTRPRKVYDTLAEWKTTGLDKKSKSDDPKFVQTIKLKSRKNGMHLDLTLLPLSPALKMVPSFWDDTAAADAWLPSYVDSSDLSTDILGNPRLTKGTAAGANEKESSTGFYGQDIFASPLDIGPIKNCEVNPLHELIFRRLDIWYPTFDRGYFYSFEREYYLYARKDCKYIGELARTEFQLPSRIVTTLPVEIAVAGKELKNPKYLDVLGDKIVLYHLDLPIITRDEEIEINCWVAQWRNQGFSYLKSHYRYKVRDGETKYYLPQDYVPVGPVTITDDRTNYTDPDQLCNREFSVEFDEDEQKSEIVFSNNTNLVQNAQFDYRFGKVGQAAPTKWESSGAYVDTGCYPNYTVKGDYKCVLDSGNYIRQKMPTYSGDSAFTWHTSLQGTGTCHYMFEFYDADFNRVGVQASGSYAPGTSTAWTRHHMGFGETYPYSGDLPVVDHPVSGVTTAFVPEKAMWLEAKLSYEGTGLLHLDAVQYELRADPDIFHRDFKLNELTVEFETKRDKEFVDTNLAIAPVRNLAHQGFLHIPELPASHYDGPISSQVTTLHEWRWPEGRMGILPWARQSGKDKLRKRVSRVFHQRPQTKKEVITPVHPVAEPAAIFLAPDVPVVRLGDTNGVGLSISCLDTDSNPYGLGNYRLYITDGMQRFPGWLLQKQYGLREQLGQGVFGRLSSAGTAQAVWLPPSKDAGLWVGQVPTPRVVGKGSTEQVSSIETQYAVNLDFHGNIVILRSGDTPLPTSAEAPIFGIYNPGYAKDYSRASLDYPVVPGTVKVFVEGRELVETTFASPESDQYHVDYETSVITVKGRVKELEIQYRPSYVFINPANPYRIMFYHDRVFSGYQTGSITVGHDIMIRLDTVIGRSDLSTLTERFALVGQNPLTSATKKFNVTALEI